MYFGNTKIIRLNLNTKYILFFSKVFKYKIVFCISNTYFKYMYLKYCPSLAAGTGQILLLAGQFWPAGRLLPTTALDLSVT